VAFVLYSFGKATTEVIYKEARPRIGTASHEYHYNPAGKTDPFQPFILDRVQNLIQTQNKEQELVVEIKTELQKYPVSQLVLKGIAMYQGETLAVVRVPKEGKAYFIKKGTLVGPHGGEVEEIIPRSDPGDLHSPAFGKVVVKEPYLNAEGEKKYRRMELTVNRFRRR
jgi:Tfp pilus assembly protein PilP